MFHLLIGTLAERERKGRQMSKRCHHCGFHNSDDVYFCRSCGEPLDAELELAMKLKENRNHPQQPSEQPSHQEEEDDYVKKEAPKKKKTSYYWVVAVVLLAAVGAAAWFFLH